MIIGTVRAKLNRLQRELGYRVGYLPAGMPILVYQMGKVGSSSVTASLKARGVESTFHVHRMDPDNIRSVRQGHARRNRSPLDERHGELLYRYVIAKRRPGKVITLVREPISRNVSAFFENFTTFTGVAYEDSGFTTDQIIDIFIREYDHSVPLSWFDVELKKTLGIDIFEHPFPFEAGYATIANGALDLLLITAETDDPTKICS